MKKLFFLVFFALLSSTVIAKSNISIAYIDMDKVVSESKAGVSILNQLSSFNDKNIKNFTNKKNELKKKENKIISQKNILSEKEFQTNIENLKIEIQTFNKDRNKIISDFNKLKINNTNKLLQLINPILANYSDKNSISIILQKKNLIIGKTELDITNKIIDLVNKGIKEFKIK